jgi:hypothetical protein
MKILQINNTTVINFDNICSLEICLGFEVDAPPLDKAETFLVIYLTNGRKYAIKNNSITAKSVYQKLEIEPLTF